MSRHPRLTRSRSIPTSGPPKAYQPTASQSPAQDSQALAAIFTTSAFTGASSGEVPASAMYGGTNAAESGVTDGIVSAGDGVNPATGDYATRARDAWVATYGPGLSDLQHLRPRNSPRHRA